MTFFPLNWFATDLSIHRNCRPLAPSTMAALFESFSENLNCTWTTGILELQLIKFKFCCLLAKLPLIVGAFFS